MNYGAQIKQALLEREKRRKQEEKERLENRLKEFAESWLSEARAGKGTEFFKLFPQEKRNSMLSLNGASKTALLSKKTAVVAIEL